MTHTPGPLWPLMLPPDQQGRDDLCTVSAHGVRVRFADGGERLCGTSGLWNTNLGYGNEAIAQATFAAMRDASYLSSWGYENTYARRAAQALLDLAGPEHYRRVLFSTSGGAANDMAMKLVRHYQVLQGKHKRRGIVGLSNGFHGLTYGAFALTDAQLGHRMYGVDRRLVQHVEPNNVGQLEALLTRLEGQIAAIVVEPLLGTGALPLTVEYIAALLRLRREHGFLIVVDEISTGFGRLGNSIFESSTWPERPDVLITAKGLTNGTIAASALIVSQAVADAFIENGAVLGHAETQAGTSVACAAILATVSEIERLDAVALSTKVSARLDAELSRMTSQSPLIRTTSGAGCLRAVILCGPDGAPLDQAQVPRVISKIRDAGALVHPGPSCVQLLPALIYSDPDLEELLARVATGLTAYAEEVF